MDALHARYPFLEAAREAVREAGVDLAAVVSEEEAVVVRARDRVRAAIDEGRVGAPHRSVRVELLSYPVARVLVSLVDEPGLTRRYARAEADTARERFVADIEEGAELRSVERAAVSLDRLLREFDLAGAVSRRDAGGPRGDGFAVGVGSYLSLSAGLDGDRWRLATRSLAGGAVAVTREELYDLLREAIRERVEEGLPLDVPAEVADELGPAVEDLRGELAEVDPPAPDAVVPDLFPPCMEALRERAAEEHLPPHSRFALAAFLATIGMGTDEIASHFRGDAGAIEEQVARLRDGDGVEYPPPSCATMVAYGDCVNTDSLCERIAHPLEYYGERLDGATPDQARPESQ